MDVPQSEDLWILTTFHPDYSSSSTRWFVNPEYCQNKSADLSWASSASVYAEPSLLLATKPRSQTLPLRSHFDATESWTKIRLRCDVFFLFDLTWTHRGFPTISPSHNLDVSSVSDTYHFGLCLLVFGCVVLFSSPCFALLWYRPRCLVWGLRRLLEHSQGSQASARPVTHGSRDNSHVVS